MFKINWDKTNNGVKLTSKSSEENLSVAPRPVFYEELDMLGLDKLWSYPKCAEPLLWACDRKYFYCGKLIMEVKGGNLYDAPEKILPISNKKIKLKPISFDTLYNINKEYMFLLESEAIQFINSTYLQYLNKSEKSNINQVVDFVELAEKQAKKYKEIMAVVKQDCDSFDILPLELANDESKPIYYATNIDIFLASYSGGKDSQVLLDLVTRAIPSDDFVVIYSDTDYELPPSLEIYEKTQIFYRSRYPNLKFYTSRNHQRVTDYWEKIGTPSNFYRWCCSVMKTAPLYKLLKNLNGFEKQPKTLTFDGVRAEESETRSHYRRIGKGVKHNGVINASPLLSWSVTEIFLYIFSHKLPLNIIYRLGFTRAGCIICPFSSPWNDRLSKLYFPDKLDPFLGIINSTVEKSGVKDVTEYIKEGKWKLRAGGRVMSNTSNLEIITTSPDFKGILTSPKEDIFTWLKVLGDYKTISVDGATIGEIKYKNEVYKFRVTQDNKLNITTIIFEGIGNAISFQGQLKRVLYKATFCIHCEACEVECPTGALKINNEINIDQSKCTHCHKCLNFVDKGCIVANSLSITSGNKKMENKKASMNRYNNFGFRDEWLSKYLSTMDRFFESDHGLNPKEQIPSLVNWLRDAEILNISEKTPTELGKILSNKYLQKPNEVWEIIWINISRNSLIVSWYCKNIIWGSELSKSDLETLIQNDYPEYTGKTIPNAVYTLLNTFKNSPLGTTFGFGIHEKNVIRKTPYEGVSNIGVAYSLFRYAEDKKRYNLKISEFYEESNLIGVYKEFGLSRTKFELILRSLNNEKNKVLTADLNMGLEHISLREDVSSLDVLKLML